MKTLAIVVLALISSVSCTLFSQRVFQSPADRRPDSVVSQSDLTFLELKELLLKADRPTIASVLNQIASSHPRYMRHFALAYDSRSLHESSFKDPRAIVFGKTADFIISFNGASDQRAYDKLEVMEFSRESGHQFREIVLKAEPGSSSDLRPEEIEIATEDVIISKPNIQKCTQCHGSPVRPIFQPYPIWPGLYGSDDDLLFAGEGAVGRLDVVPPNPEFIGYELYLKNRSDSQGRPHPRYSHLRVVDRENLPNITNPFPQKSGEALEPECDSRPNLCLNKLLADQMTQLMVTRIASGPDTTARLRYLVGLSCYREEYYLAQSRLSGGENEIERQEHRLRQEHSRKVDQMDQRHFGRELVEFRRKRSLLRTRAAQSASEVLEEDLNQIDHNYEGRLTLHSQDLSSLSRTERVRRVVSYFDRALLNYMRDGRFVLAPHLSAVLEMWGIESTDFSITLRRQAVFEDGLGGFSTLGLRSREELQRLTGARSLPTCREVLRPR